MYKKKEQQMKAPLTFEQIQRMAAEKYRTLKFTDDFLFCKILQECPDITQELVELVLNRKVRKVVVQKQEAIELTSDGKGIRLDVYVEEKNDAIYDLEMQTTNKPELPKRSRYYQGMIDLNSIRRGAKYEELRKTYIIFFCLKDPFGYGNHIYTFENRCREMEDLLLGDDTYKIFLNASGTKDDVPEKMLDFFEMLKTGEGKTLFTKKIMKEVERAKTHEEWRTEYMTLFMRDEEMRAEGRAEGRTQGIAIGRASSILDILSTLGPISEKTKMRIESEMNLDLLCDWLKIAVKCTSVEEFENHITSENSK